MNSLLLTKFVVLEKSYEELVKDEQQAIANNDFDALMNTYLQLFKYYFKNKQYAQSIVVLKDCEKFLDDFENNQLLLELLRCKTLTMALNYQLQETMALAAKTIQRANKHDDKEMLALCYYILSKCNATFGRFELARKHASLSYFFIKERKPRLDDLESIIFNHYLLCLLQLGKVKKVEQLLERNGGIALGITSKLTDGTRALSIDEISKAVTYYKNFVELIEEFDIEIFMVLALDYIAQQISPYLKGEQSIEVIELQTLLINYRKKFSMLQFSVEHQYISKFNMDLYPLELFLYNGQALLEDKKDDELIICTFIQVNSKEKNNNVMHNFMMEHILVQLEQYIQKTVVSNYLIGKVSSNSIFSVFVIPALGQGIIMEIQKNVEEQVLQQFAKKDIELQYISVVNNTTEITDFFEIYTNTVAQIFI